MSEQEYLIRIDIFAEEDDLETTTGVLALAAPFGWEEESLPSGATRCTVHTEYAEWSEQFLKTITATLPNARVEHQRVPKEDWAVAWKEFFTPVECGSRFLVLAPWMEPPAHNTRQVIVIEPKTAFGTGHHPTTALCLSAISDLADAGIITSGMTFFDIGAGSGILSIGAAKLGLTGLAVDIDELAVDNCRENFLINHVADAIEVRQGSTQYVEATFDCIFANILAQPLKELASDIVARLKPGGSLILSGLLGIQMDGVEAAYTACGLPAPRREQDGEWAALIWPPSA